MRVECKHCEWMRNTPDDDPIRSAIDHEILIDLHMAGAHPDVEHKSNLTPMGVL